MQIRVPLYGEEGDSSIDSKVFYFNRESIITPHNGDWRLIRLGDHHSAIERYESGYWLFHSNFGGSLEANDLILHDRNGTITYRDSTGQKRMMARVSLVDQGTAFGCAEAGMSLINNGRLESYRTGSILHTSPILGDDSVPIVTQVYEYETDINPFTLTTTQYTIFTSNVPDGTIYRFCLVDPTDGLVVFENISEYDFTIGQGPLVGEGSTTYTFHPCFNLLKNTFLTVKFFFSNPITLATNGSKPKRQFIYRMITPSSIAVIPLKEVIPSVEITEVLPLYQNLYTATYSVLEPDKIYRVIFISTVVGSNPSLKWQLCFYVNGMCVKEEELGVGYVQFEYMHAPTTAEEGYDIEVAKHLLAGTIELTNSFFIVEEL